MKLRSHFAGSLLLSNDERGRKERNRQRKKERRKKEKKMNEEWKEVMMKVKTKTESVTSKRRNKGRLGMNEKTTVHGLYTFSHGCVIQRSYYE